MSKTPKYADLTQEQIQGKLNDMSGSYPTELQDQKSYTANQIYNNAKLNPGIYKIDTKNDFYQDTIKSFVDSPPKEGQDTKSVEAINVAYKEKRDLLLKAASHNNFEVSIPENLTDNSMSQDKEKIRDSFKNIDQAKKLVGQKAIEEITGQIPFENDEGKPISGETVNNLKSQLSSSIEVTPKMYKALMDKNPDNPVKKNIREAIHEKALENFSKDDSHHIDGGIEKAKLDEAKLTEGNIKDFSDKVKGELTNRSRTNSFRDLANTPPSKRNLAVAAATVVAPAPAAIALSISKKQASIDAAKSIGASIKGKIASGATRVHTAVKGKSTDKGQGR